MATTSETEARKALAALALTDVQRGMYKGLSAEPQNFYHIASAGGVAGTRKIEGLDSLAVLCDLGLAVEDEPQGSGSPLRVWRLA